MSQFHTSHFHNGWYDTQFCMPIVVQHPCPYHTSPFPVLPYYTWMNTPQMQERPPPPNRPQTPKPDPTPTPSPPAPKRATAPPTKSSLRSILKHPRLFPNHPNNKKSVRFTLSTASPPLAAPGTYKYAGTPKTSKARHPARSHPCLISTLQQRAQQAMAAVQGPPPTTPQSVKYVSNTSNRMQQRPAGRISRPPTPPPADFFRKPNKVQLQLQWTAQRPPVQSNTSAPRQPAPAPQSVAIHRTPKQTPASTIAYTGPYSSDSEDSNTDVRMAKGVAVNKPNPTQTEVKAKARARKVDAEMRRSLMALAREFDRKNAWWRAGSA